MRLNCIAFETTILVCAIYERIRHLTIFCINVDMNRLNSFLNTKFALLMYLTTNKTFKYNGLHDTPVT